jgi:hypothetical protein
MRADPRLRRLERSMSPTQLVLAFLAIAHRHRSADDYVRSLLAQPGSASPLTSIVGRVEVVMPRRHRGARASEIRVVVRQGADHAAFLYHLALGLDAAALAFAASGTLRIEVVKLRLGDAFEDTLSRRARSADADDPVIVSWRLWRDAALALVDEIRIEDEARLELEHVHLRGRTALFDETVDAWQQLLHDADGLERLARLLAHRHHKPVRSRRRRRARRGRGLQPRVDLRVQRLTAQARVEALGDVGRDDEAATIVRSWL